MLTPVWHRLTDNGELVRELTVLVHGTMPCLLAEVTPRLHFVEELGDGRCTLLRRWGIEAWALQGWGLLRHGE